MASLDPEPQPVAAPLTSAALFLVVSLGPAEDDAATARGVVAEIGDLVRAVGFRSAADDLSCVVGIGAEAWHRFGIPDRPQQLRPFQAVRGARYDAPATPGDLLFHIRAERADLCIELARLILAALGESAGVEDETHGFRYFDTRDLLGFVDGTENPVGAELTEAVFIGEEDPAFAGGSYAVIQKYTHDLAGWDALTTERQEEIIGRTKADDVELPDGVQAPDSHVALNTIVDEQGVEHDILRGNMPFRNPVTGEMGLVYLGYARDLWVIERMLENMFVGDPAGSYDHILDHSTARTGTTFFVPSRPVLEGLAKEQPEPDPDPEPVSDPGAGSLRIGGLDLTPDDTTRE